MINFKAGDKVVRKSSFISGEWKEHCDEAGLKTTDVYTVSRVRSNRNLMLAELPLYWIPEAFELLDLGAVKDTDMKHDQGKPRMDLLIDGCPRALEAVAGILTFGAEKYADHSWQGVERGEERYKAALLRHLTAVSKGESTDSESGMSHLAHAACNALFILELELRKHA